MKPLPLLKVALASACFFLFTSFTPRKAASFFKASNQYYYWYVDGGTVYEGWYSTAEEITQLEDEYDVEVDTDPLDGTLIASGYAFYGLPHEVYASVLLYSH
jgi:hypothetical protein